MKRKIHLAALTIVLVLFTNAYGDLPITSGAEKYDWQSCINSKTNDCVNSSCQTSSDINCTANCKNMAKDKCLSQGLREPQ